MADFMQGEISADEQFGAPAEKPVMQQIEEQGQQPSPTGEVSADAQFGRAAPPAPFPTIDEGASGFFGPEGAGAAAGKTALQIMEMPLNMVQGALQEIVARGPQDTPERIRRSWANVKDQFGLNPPPTLNMGEILAEDMIRNGMDPEIAMELGNNMGAIHAIGFDPLTWINAPVKMAKGVAKGVAQMARSTPSPQSLAKIAKGNPAPSTVDKILGKFTNTPPESITVLKSVPEQVRQAKEIGDLVSEANGVIKRVKSERKAAIEEVRIAKENLAALTKATRNDLRNHTLPEEVMDQFMVNLRDLRQRVSVSSSQAFDVLEESGERVDFEGVISYLDKVSNRATVGGVPPPPGSESNLARQKVMRVRDFFKQIQETQKTALGYVPASQAKATIQLLDDEIGVIYDKLGRGERVTQTERSLLEARSMLNNQLMKIDGYKEVMKPLAKDVQILSDARDLVRRGEDPSRIFKDEKLGRPILTHFDEAFQTNYLGEMENYHFSKKANRDLRTFESIPEIAAAQYQYEAAKANRGAADEALSILGPWADEDASEKILMDLMNGKKTDWERGAERISDILSEGGIRRNLMDEIVASQLRKQLELVDPNFEKGKWPKLFNLNTLGVGGFGGAYGVQKLAAGDPTVFSGLVTAATLVGIGTFRRVYGPKVAKAFVEAAAKKKLTKATLTGRKGKLENLAKLIFDGDRAINVAPGIVNQIVQKNSDLNVMGRISIQDPDELNELRVLVMASDLEPTQKAQVISAINGGIVDIDLGDSEEVIKRKQERFKERNKMDLKSLNKILNVKKQPLRAE